MKFANHWVYILYSRILYITHEGSKSYVYEIKCWRYNPFIQSLQSCLPSFAFWTTHWQFCLPFFPPMSIKWFEFGQPSDLRSTGETCSTGCMLSCFYWSELWRLTRQHTSPGSIQLSLCAHLVIGGFKYSPSKSGLLICLQKDVFCLHHFWIDLKQRGSAIQPRVGVDSFFLRNKQN